MCGGSCDKQILPYVEALLSGVELAAMQMNKDNKMTCYFAPNVRETAVRYGVVVPVSEWLWRHFAEDEDCWFYTIFQTQRNSNK